MSNCLQTSIRIPVLLWASLVPELARRGCGKRESGAFVLGSRTRGYYKASVYLCYDDLDPASLTGGVDFHASGYAALWEYCRTHGLDVLFDVHTHPGLNIQQSSIDRNHPMIPQVGHVAMILPNYGRTSRWSFRDIGIYEYRGNFRWHTLNQQSNRRVRLSVW